MPIFIIKTWEHVEGTYEVRAANEEEARAMFQTPKTMIKAMDNEKVDQLDYQAFETEVHQVDQLSF